MDFKFDLQRFANTIYTGGQLKFGADNNSSSMFALNLKINANCSVTLNGSVQEQSAPVTYNAPASGYSYYLPVSVDTAGVVTFGTLKAYGSALHTEYTDPSDPDTAYQTYEYTAVAETAMNAIAEAITAGKFSGGITFTSSASSLVNVNFTNFTVPVTVKSAAANSLLTLKEGDTATTAALKVGQKVTANGVDYTAAVAGTMTFVGETIADTTDPDNPTYTYETTLQAGTIALATGTTAKLSGATNSNSDDVTVTTTDTGIIVKAAAGKVTGITGLDGVGATATVTEHSVSGTTETTVETVYTVMDAAGKGTMVSKTVTTTVGTATFDPVITYANLAGSTADLTKASYKEAVVTAIGGYGSSSSTGAHAMYYFLNATDAAATATAAGATIDASNTTRTTAAQLAVGNFVATAGAYYLKVSSNTKSGPPVTTTISAVELWQANAEGKLTKVSTAYAGTVPSIPANDAAINYTKPKNAAFKVSFTNADIRSKFTNLNLGTGSDSVTTKDDTYSNLGSGTYTVYGGTAVSNTVTIKGKVNVTVAGNAVDEITGLDNGETVTFTVADTVNGGTKTRTIQATAAGKVTITDIAGNGKKHVYTGVAVTNLSTANITNDATFTAGIAALDAKDVTVSYESNFNWTMSGSADGYFAITGTGKAAKAAVKAGKNTISAADAKARKTYVHASVDAAGAVTLENVVTAAVLDAEGVVTDITTPVDTADFNGTVTLTASSTTPITGLTRSIGDNATLIIKDLAANSVIAANTLKEQDMVTTVKLSAGAQVTVNGAVYVSGANNNAITIQDDKLYSGTLLSDTTTGTTVSVGDYTIETTRGSITVTGNAGKTFSLGELSDLDTVMVSKAGGTPVAYTKYGSYLYDAGNNKMYSLGKNNSISSAALTGTSGWKTYGASTGDVTVNLALADASIKKNSTTTYEFITNINAESTKLAAARTAEVATAGTATAAGASAYIRKEGDVTSATTYEAATQQTINVTNGWTVTASDNGATINGAASGTDTLIGGNGNDSFNLKGADDRVNIIDFKGVDEISGYATGKDKITIGATTIKYTLSTTKSGDVYADADGSVEDDYVLLKGVGSKAVEINGLDHYFGDGTKTTGAATFTYADGAFYHGNAALDTTLKVGTLKDKASKTNVVDNPITINMTDANYEEIDNVDASGSANTVELVAAAGGSTLKGGTYKSKLTGDAGADTLVGGKGDDTFDISSLAGKDVIQDYNKSGTDKLVVGTALKAADVAVSDNDVVIGGLAATNNVTIQKAAGNAITVETTAGAKQTVYVGKGGKDNTFTVTAAPEPTDVYVGSIGTDTIVLKKSVTGLEVADTDPTHYEIKQYQGGEIDFDTNVDSYSSIDAVDASGVKATAAALSEYGTKFIKAHAGVSVKAAATGTAFTGSAYSDLFTGGVGKDIVNYSVGSGYDIIDGFGVDDVFKLTGLSAADISSIESAVAAGGTALADQLTNDGISFVAGGSVKLTNAAAANYSVSKSGNTITITGTN